MKTKLIEQLKTKCKSFGLTKKALEELAELASADFTEETTDEEIAAKADSLVPYAKAMQGEITRKTRKASSAEKPSKDEGEGEDEDGAPALPKWFEPYHAKMSALEKENAELKQAREQATRAAQIADKAKSLGIPDFLVKRLHIADDADIDAELASVKQDLVSNSLMPKGQVHEIGLDATQATADAKAWAAGLPD